MDTVSIKETPGTEYVLVDLLRSWKLPESVVGKISDRWKCQIAPFATDEADLNQHVLDGTPVLTPSRFGERACSSVGEDCLEYLIDNPYATFLFRVHGWSMVLEANRCNAADILFGLSTWQGTKHVPQTKNCIRRGLGSAR